MNLLKKILIKDGYRKKLPAGWRKGQCPFKIKRCFLGDGKFKRKPALSRIILTLVNTSWRRKNIHGGWNSQREANTSNGIVAMLKAP